MIDTHQPCLGQVNWSASIDSKGGTPGKLNSINAAITDLKAPVLTRSYSEGDSVIMLVFDEPMDSLKAAAIVNYSVSNGLTVTRALAANPLFDEVRLSVSPAMQTGTIYHITVQNLADCHQNRMVNTSVPGGIPGAVRKNEWLINEILFNPRPGGEDYVEFYNAGKSIIDLSKVYVANRNTGGTAGTAYVLTEKPFYVFPGDYLVITTNKQSLTREYLVKDLSAIIEMKSMPSLPDDEGSVLTLNATGDIVDELHYLDDWHFKLIADPEGVALERLDPLAKTQDPSNWHSASTSSGYGTPGYLNSQRLRGSANVESVSIEPRVFSPDNDGRDDVAMIRFVSVAPGKVVQIRIYNAAGLLVRRLANNALGGLDNRWSWDGLDDQGAKLPIGPYLVLVNYFDLQAQQQESRQTVILLRTLN
jgi:hypothetical protein